ncbi:MAG: hypothetical protein EB037_08190, partial [Actinobacteria bacterium]|nr:hypothetical protein [Actinomycetota bacterium]
MARIPAPSSRSSRTPTPAVNAMIGLWGEIDDYDEWERDFGCVGWSWREVEKYFHRIEVPLHRASPEG